MHRSEQTFPSSISQNGVLAASPARCDGCHNPGLGVLSWNLLLAQAAKNQQELHISQGGLSLPPHLPYLLELIEEGVLVLPAAALLHPLLDHPVQDGGDSISTHPLQQLQPAAAGTGTLSGASGNKGTSKSRKSYT